jgi:hypothetical protein
MYPIGANRVRPIPRKVHVLPCRLGQWVAHGRCFGPVGRGACRGAVAVEDHVVPGASDLLFGALKEALRIAACLLKPGCSPILPSEVDVLAD